MSSTPNVLLVVMDSVRARNTTLHGHRRDTTPFLDSLGRRATVYEQARSPGQWSLPSHASMFTGLHVVEHGLIEKYDRLEPGHSVFDRLRERGYATGLFSENPYLTGLDSGLMEPFDTVESSSKEPLFEGANPNRYRGDPAGFLRAAVRSGHPVGSVLNGLVTKAAWDRPDLVPDSVMQRLAGGIHEARLYEEAFLDWQAEREEPWAACINFMDAHHSYTPTGEYNRWDDGRIESLKDDIPSIPVSFYTGDAEWWQCELLEHLYDGAILQIDDAIRRIVETLDERGTLEDTLLIVTSDHGEGFGERSRLRPIRLAGHDVGGLEVNFHVPLVVKYPGQREGRRVRSPVSLTDFPDAVEAAPVWQDADSDPFLTPGPVLASAHGSKQGRIDALREAGVDVDPYRGDLYVRYDGRERTVRKRVEWRTRSLRVEIFDAYTSVVEGSGAGDGAIADAFGGLTDAGVRASGREDVDAITEKRLEELGYR
jgi:arylsulfatase A-like enzyme